MQLWQRCWQAVGHRFDVRVDSDLLAYFRIIFGMVGVTWVVKRFHSGAIDSFYIAPEHHFHYFGFAFVAELPPSHIEFGVLGLAALLVAAGLWFRVAALVFAVVFTHLFLVDKCLYQNHYYLMCLLAWILPVLPCDRAWTLWCAKGLREKDTSVPFGALWLLRFQLAVPYVYGGIAKLSSDWLAGEPMRQMLLQRADFPLVGAFFLEEWCVMGFTYGGLLFDLLIVPLLFVRGFRIVAFAWAIAFHVINASKRSPP